jgi:hypothetical protein
MNRDVITIEADTLDEAQDLVKAKISEGLEVFSETVISDGIPK